MHTSLVTAENVLVSCSLQMGMYVLYVFLIYIKVHFECFLNISIKVDFSIRQLNFS